MDIFNKWKASPFKRDCMSMMGWYRDNIPMLRKIGAWPDQERR